ncbi:MAG: hypothetical protein K6F77_03475 [Lachnospiraceae bacterium]|nr:hypothetical protein [Lachnospiraceae bacterium]
MSKKKSELELAQERVQKTIDETNKKIDELGKETYDLYVSLTKIQELFDTIRNIPSEDKLKYEKLKKVRLEWKKQVDKIEEDYKKAAAKNAGAGAAGAGVGVAVVAMGPSVAMGVATTFGVASTGTAISTLSGAAATNAALAWLGGGALTAGGGGMVAGQALLSLAGPIGWAIAGVSILTSGILFFKSKKDQAILEDIFISICERDEKSYQLAIVELNERIKRIINETKMLNEGFKEMLTFGIDYKKMTEKQQYLLGAYVNLMLSSTQLLVNPILGLQPKYTEEDFNKYLAWPRKDAEDSICKENKVLIITLANFLYGILLDPNEQKLLWKSLKKNKEMLKSMGVSKRDFSFEIMDIVEEALDYKKR